MSAKVVIDTNVLLISIPKQSPYRPIFDALVNKKFELVISNEILFEYAEIIERKTNSIVSKNLCELLLALDNVVRTEIYFKWNLILKDPDDNKFIDSALSGHANFIVTNDTHFAELRSIPFPKVGIMSADEFLEFLESKNDRYNT